MYSLSRLWITESPECSRAGIDQTGHSEDCPLLKEWLLWSRSQWPAIRAEGEQGRDIERTTLLGRLQQVKVLATIDLVPGYTGEEYLIWTHQTTPQRVLSHPYGSGYRTNVHPEVPER